MPDQMNSNGSINQDRPGNYIINKKKKKQPRFPTFQDPKIMNPESVNSHNNNTMDSFKSPDSMGNSEYTRPEFFNFYGVLNFKVRKYNKSRVSKAFDLIYERACDVDSKIRLFAFASLLKKDHVLLQLARLGTEVNRRFNAKNQNLFRMSKSLNTKKKICMRMFFRFLGPTGNQMDVSDAGTYVGNLSIFCIYLLFITVCKTN